VGACDGHGPARFRAFAARVGTFLTMIHLVLATFLATGVAHLGAELANFLRELRAARHLSHRERADIGATAIQLDASNQLRDFAFMQTRRCTVLAGLHALMTGFDAVLVFFVGHGFSPGLLCEVRSAEWNSAAALPQHR
jgi:hypothetical protein